MKTAKKITLTVNELQNMIEKCKVLTEREVCKGEKIVKDRYVSVKQLLRCLKSFQHK